MNESDNERFAAIATDIVEPVRRFAARRTDPTTAEDIVAETLLVCWRRLPDVPTEAAVPWAIGVARLALGNAERAARRQSRLASRIAVIDPPATIAPHHGEPDDENARAVTSALAQLPDNDAEILRLWAWEELTPAEIGIALDITANAAGVRLHRAKTKLRAHLLTNTRSDDTKGQAL